MRGSTHLDIQTSTEESIARVCLSGELDLDGVDAVTAALTGVACNGVSSVLVDASELTFLDSSGLRALLTGHQALGALDVTMALDKASPAVDRVLEITGTRQLLRSG
ncbi:MAG: STAS domain-containing protein [Acidimicrobiales bacterium]